MEEGEGDRGWGAGRRRGGDGPERPRSPRGHTGSRDARARKQGPCGASTRKQVRRRRAGKEDQGWAAQVGLRGRLWRLLVSTAAHGRPHAKADSATLRGSDQKHSDLRHPVLAAISPPSSLQREFAEIPLMHIPPSKSLLLWKTRSLFGDRPPE